MEARIRKDDLVAFKTQASAIKNASQLNPILDYLKVEIEGDFCTITKSNNKKFIIKTIGNDSDDCSFLVNEDILNTFIEYSEGDYINFLIESIRVKISDNRTSVFSQTESSKMFPFVDVSNRDGVMLPKLALASAGIASALIFDGEILGPKSNVFIGAKAVAGTDGNIGFLQPLLEDVPEMVLSKDVAVCISKMNTCKVSKNDNYDLFSDDDTLYGFIKNEIPFFDLNKVFKPIEEEECNFSANKNQLIKFSGLCGGTTTTKLLSATWNVEQNNLKLEMIDSKMGIDIHSTVPIRGDGGEFKFNPAYLSTLLKVLPAEECFFYQLRDRYVITDIDRSFISAIMLII